MSRRVSSNQIVGRARELELGCGVLQRALDGSPGRGVPLLLISGEAGIGKTRLLDELLGRARQAGAVTACGRCLQHGGEIRPLSAVQEILAELTPAIDASAMAHRLDLEPLLGAGSSGPPSTALSQSPARLHDEVRSLLSRLAARSPLVIAIEDLHWSDRTTRALLAELVRSRGLERVLLIGTYRSDELHRRHPLLGLLADVEHAARPERIDLVALDDTDIAELAAAILDRAVSDEAGRALARRSGGNPFYAEELLAADADAERLPSGVRHVILARSQDLEPGAVACLQAASILAAPIDPSVLAMTADLDLDRYRTAVDALCRERFLVEGDAGFGFRHDLVREVFLDELLPGERTRLFARAAAALALHRPERLGEIARLHFNAVELPEALRASVRAAEAAAAIGAPAEASEHYGRALDIWDRVDDPSERAGVSYVQLLRQAAKMADQARDFDLAVELARSAADELAQGDDPFEAGSALLDLAVYLWNASAPGMDDAIERGLAIIPPEPPSVERARLEVRLAGRLRFQGESAAADAALERAAAMASALGERGVEANARSHIGIEQAHLGDERAVRRLYHGLRLASSVDDGFITTVINTNLSNVLVFLGRFGEAVDLHHEGIAVADRHGLRTTSGIIFESNILEALEALGRWDEAEAIVDDIKRRLSPESIHRWASALVGWTQIQIHRGHHAEVAASYRRGFELRETGYYSGDLAQLASGLIELAAAGAVEPIDAAAVEAWLDRLPDHESSAGARIVAMAARHLVPPPAASGHRAMAELTDGWIGRLQRIADEEFISVPPVLDAWLDQARAELAEAGGAPAPDRWERLVTSWDELGCRYFAAVARYRQADALLRAGGGRSAADRAVATGLLADADRTAEELAAGPLRDDIDDLARRARLRIGDGADLPAAERPAAEPAPFGLTGRELEVLRLASEGRSNGEIGAELFISTKTASVHVSNILRKLGAANRIEAAAIARRHNIFDR